jgi:hypothetical protein
VSLQEDDELIIIYLRKFVSSSIMENLVQADEGCLGIIDINGRFHDTKGYQVDP